MKLKDYFTLGNLLCGFAAVVALFHDYFVWACYLIYLGYIFDVLDGPVARLTKQFDRFGGLFDEVSDYITNSIAVSFIIYYAFWKNAHYHWLLAAVIAAFPFAFGTIRQAKSMEKNISYPCYWLGVPRPVAAIFVLALLNSSVFNIPASPWRELGQGVVAGLVVLLSMFHLSRIPFVNHHDRRWMGMLRFGMLAFLAGTPVSFAIGWFFLDWPALVYDYILFCMLIYLGLSWTQIPTEDLRRIRQYLGEGTLVRPLVHKEDTWRPKSLAPFFSRGVIDSNDGDGTSSGSPPSVAPDPGHHPV